MKRPILSDAWRAGLVAAVLLCLPFAPQAFAQSDTPPPQGVSRGENFSAKPPAQLFASDCTGAGCHKSPQGLAKGQSQSGLAGFLREHYTNSRESAASLAGYLVRAPAGAAPEPRAARTAPAPRGPSWFDPEAAKPEPPKPAEARKPPAPAARPSRAAAAPRGSEDEPASKPPGAETTPMPVPAPEAKPEPEAKPKPEPEAKPAPEAKPVREAKPVPEPKPKPVPRNQRGRQPVTAAAPPPAPEPPPAPVAPPPPPSFDIFD